MVNVHFRLMHISYRLEVIVYMYLETYLYVGNNISIRKHICYAHSPLHIHTYTHTHIEASIKLMLSKIVGQVTLQQFATLNTFNYVYM